jgi:L-alanine-DL-glutamate epimerase-like enolase superfamily enzyme
LKKKIMSKIDSIDFFYLSMPEVLDIGDGSQDALLVRVTAGEMVGWGECEAAPLPTIASLVCPMSHAACKPVAASVLGQVVDAPDDIFRIHRTVRENSMDLLQADHALSGIDVALWDLLGRMRQEPVYRLLGDAHAYPKTPYASLLFGDTPQDTLEKARGVRASGFRAVKFGWGPFGHGSLRADVEHVHAAREGLGPEGILCIDAGTVWGTDYEAAAQRLPVMQECRVTWLEEPFHTGAFHQYARLAELGGAVKMAGGEGAHNEFMGQQMIDYAGVGYIQIETGRVGGITSARRVAQYAVERGVKFVNHTFTSHLALSASLQPYAGLKDSVLCEYPQELKSLAVELTAEHLLRNADGEILLPEKPGLGLEPDSQALQKYLVDTQISVNGKVLYQTPTL